MHLASFVQVPSEDGSVDDTGVEEAIVPTDMNLLTGEAISPSHFWRCSGIGLYYVNPLLS